VFTHPRPSWGYQFFRLRPSPHICVEHPIPADPIPVQVDAHGAARVGGTRVTLDTIVSVFNQGVSAEEIQAKFPTVDLADIYATIGYYLRHRSEVEAYLCERERLGAEVRKENEARFNAGGLRERILARHAELRKAR
ncbi:MAG: DUF433 domain-containing protein, partial [Dehalococcoidia bacterium]